MAIVSPGITGLLGFKYAWPSAMLLYWLTANTIAILQQRLALASDAPRWLATSSDYALFLSGRAYPRTVDVRRARWAAIGLLACGVFAIVTQVGQISYHEISGGPLCLFVISAMMTGFFFGIMRVTRGIALP